ADNDSMFGGIGQDALQGDDGDDRLDGGTGRDSMDGGTGFDLLFANMGYETLSHGEHVEITVPGGSPQNDSWSCGPNSASRLLRSYGIGVSYDTLKADAQNSNIISQYGLGTPPPSLQSIMKKYKSDVHLASNASFQSVLDRLGEGRPVIALLGWGETTVPVFEPWSPVPVEFDTAPDTLHYVCLTGFDMSSSTIFYTDTNGAAKSMSFSAFQKKWNWPGDGLVYDGLAAMGVKKQTMLW
ncbi:MAG TPA: C39 family peptidase, partial [Gemmataceae bacterium]|nr:C39 family peptidase [Gemmataceae bacterium]